MNLVKAELSRFFSRRFIQIMMVVLMAAFGITVSTVMAESEAPSPYMWEQARMEAEQARDNRAREFAYCLQTQRDPQNPDPDKGPDKCEQFDPARVQAENYLWGVFNFSREIGELVRLLGVFLACFGFLVMASFIGSELHSGGMTNLLLWRPNRMAVLGAKLGVAVAALAAISVVFTVLYVGTFYLLADTTGWVGETFSPFWSDLFWLAARAVGMALALGVIAFGIAVLGRHTAAALGSLIGYVVIWEIGARIVIEAMNNYGPTSNDWFLSYHLVSWMEGPRERYACDYCLVNLATWKESAATIAFVAALATVAAFVTFRRRDVA